MKYTVALFCLTACSGAPFTALEDRAPIEVPDAAPDAEPDTRAPDAGTETATGDARAPDADADHEPDADAGAPDSGVALDSDAPDTSPPPVDSGVPDTWMPPVDAGCTPLMHSNGIGQDYSDCHPLGTPGDPATYTQAMANEAAMAWPPYVRQQVGAGCGGFALAGIDSSGNYISWIFSGPWAGYIPPPLGTCPTTSTAASFKTWQ